MGASRTSNKDIADRLDTLIGIMTAQAMPVDGATLARTVVPESVVTPVTEGDEPESSIAVDEAYLAHMTAKAADHATAKGEEVVLYARKNKQGTTKLAYALRERYDNVIWRQPSHIGAVGSFQA